VIRWAVALLFVGCGLGACSSSPSSDAPPPLPRFGPARDVYDGDLGDPAVITAGPTYVLFGTDDPPDHIPTATSTDLVTWVHGPDAVPTLPAWADPDRGDRLTWAPAVAMVRGRFLLYVSVQDAAVHRQCIAALASATPLGPYTDARGSPLVCQVSLGGSIDPSIVSTGGHLHLVWKSDGNCCGLPASLWEQDLSADGMAVTGPAHRLLTADESWQGGIVENPALLPAPHGWWLFYSGNRFDVAAYATGLAWCPTLAGPCREAGNAPFLAGAALSPGQYSSGGLEFFRDRTGRLWGAFATWNRPARNGHFFCCRSLDLAPVVAGAGSG
jgi:arabinan endo-1,5-alpha-L-arabinosidase